MGTLTRTGILRATTWEGDEGEVSGNGSIGVEMLEGGMFDEVQKSRHRLLQAR